MDPTCGRQRAIFLSVPKARTPDSAQSAAEGCLFAPAATYSGVRAMVRSSDKAERSAQGTSLSSNQA